MENYNHFISLCEKLGKQAQAKGNAPVGAVVTKDDVIVGEAEESAAAKKDITGHAELDAIRLAAKKLGTNDLSDCVLYTTHEPCLMCAYAIRFHRIGKIVYQHKVKWLGAISSSMPLLTTTDVPPHWSKPPVIIKHISD